MDCLVHILHQKGVMEHTDVRPYELFQLFPALDTPAMEESGQALWQLFSIEEVFWDVYSGFLRKNPDLLMKQVVGAHFFRLV
jgi:hypothetical protein